MGGVVIVVVVVVAATVVMITAVIQCSTITDNKNCDNEMAINKDGCT